MADEDNTSNGDDIAPNATVYVRNINERVKLPLVIKSLRDIFTEFGKIEDIIAKKSLKRKGQAFIVFDDIESAQEAIDAINGFEVFGQALRCEFAKTRSDITVKNEDGEEALAQHQKERKALRDQKDAEAKAAAAEAAARNPEPSNKREHEDDDEPAARPTKIAKAGAAALIPDEYVPPNPTLTIRELPGDITSDDLRAVFSTFARFKEVRVVPHRNIAFIEYADAEAAEFAKIKTADLQLKGHAVRTAFRRTAL